MFERRKAKNPVDVLGTGDEGCEPTRRRRRETREFSCGGTKEGGRFDESRRRGG